MNSVGEIHFETFLADQSVHVVNADTNLSYTDALQVLIRQPHPLIKYPYQETILLQNVDAFRTNTNNKYYYEVDCPRDCDIIGEFRCTSTEDTRFSMILNDTHEVDLSDLTHLVTIACPYTSSKLRITFNSLPRFQGQITLKYAKYLCATHLRDQLRRSRIVTSSLVYDNGVCLYQAPTSH